jgi:cysteinyl-tRNA synthetase
LKSAATGRFSSGFRKIGIALKKPILLIFFNSLMYWFKMLKLYNTLTRKKETFKPLKKGSIGVYLCGPTVYGPAHIGHARTYIAFDIIRRYLEYRKFKVKFVVNLTDVHDDMIKRASEEGTTIFKLADKNIKLFFKDMNALGVKKADSYPRVTEHVKEIIDFVKRLEEKGYAYETSDGVYFDISKFKGYGKLSRIRMEEQKSGTRVEADKYEKGRARDFALWKKEKPNEPSWPSPWGKGRPGWHIECSVMSSKYLGKQIDVHGGAVDLIFPHHENEIAQSEAATGKKPFVRHWLHSGFLNVEGQKMSKSLGNFITMPELLAKHEAKPFRFFVGQMHYRTGINYTEKSLAKAERTLEKWDELIQRLLEAEGKSSGKEAEKLVEATRKEFVSAMDDDFNAPNAWAALQKFETAVNRLVDGKKLGKAGAKKVVSFLKEVDSVFGVFSFEKRKEKISKRDLALVKEREKLRREKKWEEADRIRKQLAEKGILLDDTQQGTRWKLVK